MAGAFSRRTVLALGAGALLAAPAHAQPAEDFYKGKVITLVVSSSPGGGYDIVGRMVARHLSRHIPGNPRIVVSNMPGAGGIVEMNYFYRNAPKDGTYIAEVQNNTPFEPLFGTTEARYDAAKFNWLGSPSTEVGLIAVWKTAPANNLAEMRVNELSMGTSGVNSTPSLYARLINETLGTKMKIIAGYPGLTEIYLAMERGEVDGFPSLFFSTLNATRPNWRTDKSIKLLLQYGLEKEPSIPDVPSVLDLVTDPEDRQLLQASFAEVSLGRPFLMPPGVPAARVALMRKAMSDTFADPGFIADARKMSLNVDSSKTGLEIQKLVEDTYRTPPKVIDRLRKLSLH